MARKPKSFEDATCIIPGLAAECICCEAARYLDSDTPMGYVEYLAEKAVRLYGCNAQYAKGARASGNRGRDYVHMFMRHWLYAKLSKEYRGLADRLPQDFAVGVPIPRCT